MNLRRGATLPLALLGGLALLGARPARAAVTTYTDRATFTAAVTGTTTTFNFTGQAVNNNSVTVDGLTITDTNDVGHGAEVSPFLADGFATGASLFDVATGILTFALPTGTTAFGVDIGPLAQTNALLTLTAGSQTATITPAENTAGFIGFTSTAPVTSATISYGNDAGYVLGDVTFGPAAPAPAPEPSPLAPFALAGLGLAGLTLRSRRRRQSAV